LSTIYHSGPEQPFQGSPRINKPYNGCHLLYDAVSKKFQKSDTTKLHYK